MNGDRIYYVIEVYEDGTADYTKIKKGCGQFYVPEKLFRPWSPIKDADEIMADVHTDIIVNCGE